MFVTKNHMKDEVARAILFTHNTVVKTVFETIADLRANAGKPDKVGVKIRLTVLDDIENALKAKIGEGAAD